MPQKRPEELYFASPHPSPPPPPPPPFSLKTFFRRPSLSAPIFLIHFWHRVSLLIASTRNPIRTVSPLLLPSLHLLLAFPRRFALSLPWLTCMFDSPGPEAPADAHRDLLLSMTCPSASLLPFIVLSPPRFTQSLVSANERLSLPKSLRLSGFSPAHLRPLLVLSEFLLSRCFLFRFLAISRLRNNSYGRNIPLSA